MPLYNQQGKCAKSVLVVNCHCGRFQHTEYLPRLGAEGDVWLGTAVLTMLLKMFFFPQESEWSSRILLKIDGPLEHGEH